MIATCLPERLNVFYLPTSIFYVSCCYSLLDKNLCLLLSNLSNLFIHTLNLNSENLNSDIWHADKTFVKISGVEHYLWFLIDSETRFVISFILSDKRDSNNVYLLFRQASHLTRAIPLYIISDQLSNNTIEAFNHTFKVWYRTKKRFGSFDSALKLITTFIFHYNFLHAQTSLDLLPPAVVTDASYSQQQIQAWLLF